LREVLATAGARPRGTLRLSNCRKETMMGLFKPMRMLRRMVLALTGIYLCLVVTQELGQAQRAPLAAEAATPSAPLPHKELAGAQLAVVERVVDGDTVTVVPRGDGLLPAGQAATVRLIGVDTPETKKPGAAVDCGGPAASAHLRKLLPAGAPVILTLDEEKSDRYGRALRYVYTGEGALVNVRLAAAGYAKALRVGPNDAHLKEIRSAAGKARKSDRGMWASCVDPFAPRS
jgi:micrococcal nuclease